MAENEANRRASIGASNGSTHQSSITSFAVPAKKQGNLGGRPQGPIWQHFDKVSKKADKSISAPLSSPAELKVWPSTLQMSALKRQLMSN
jgi:hypothetical protein